jgi:hypothetical protein
VPDCPSTRLPIFDVFADFQQRFATPLPFGEVDYIGQDRKRKENFPARVSRFTNCREGRRIHRQRLPTSVGVAMAKEGGADE